MNWRALGLALALALGVLPASGQSPSPVPTPFSFMTNVTTYPPDLAIFWITPDTQGGRTYLGRSGTILKLAARRQDELWSIYFVYTRPNEDPVTGGVRSQQLLVTPRDLEGIYPKQGGALQPTLPPEALDDYLWRRWRPMIGAGVVGVGAALGLVAWLELSRRRQGQRLRKLESLVVPDPADPLLGARLAGYLLVSRLGKGGMASVYRGLPADTLDEEGEVAVKVLDAHVEEDEEFRRRFQREVQVCRDLFHPHIVKLIDFGDQGAQRYLIMELIRGETLRAEMPPEGLPPARALRLLEPVMEALDYAHQRGIVHRDLKPENIMLTVERKGGKEPRVVVMDFGLARSHRFETVTVTGNVLGTPAYMAPEQINGKWEAATDQYALGVIAYEMLTGKRPFEAEDPIQVILQHLQNPPVGLRVHQPSLPSALEEIVLTMLAKEPHARFASMTQVREAWRQAIA